ncbi:thrombospondin, type I repeat containing protein [Babesia caballi]|uniref:Thrombospondin, type I repeat containing protein n=1 Tax=Babesia caballi TaxID=5871 RepID=A0AAV4LV09_BABCB|nr:thrombospondin, type I repeat containing protein [Babesia caballi]
MGELVLKSGKVTTVKFKSKIENPVIFTSVPATTGGLHYTTINRVTSSQFRIAIRTLKCEAGCYAVKDGREYSIQWLAMSKGSHSENLEQEITVGVISGHSGSEAILPLDPSKSWVLLLQTQESIPDLVGGHNQKRPVIAVPVVRKRHTAYKAKLLISEHARHNPIDIKLGYLAVEDTSEPNLYGLGLRTFSTMPTQDNRTTVWLHVPYTWAYPKYVFAMVNTSAMYTSAMLESDVVTLRVNDADAHPVNATKGLFEFSKQILLESAQSRRNTTQLPRIRGFIIQDRASAMLSRICKFAKKSGTLTLSETCYYECMGPSGLSSCLQHADMAECFQQKRQQCVLDAPLLKPMFEAYLDYMEQEAQQEAQAAQPPDADVDEDAADGPPNTGDAADSAEEPPAPPPRVEPPKAVEEVLVARDCIEGPWGEWSACSNKCSSERLKTVQRRRRPIYADKLGETSAPCVLVETRECEDVPPCSDFCYSREGMDNKTGFQQKYFYIGSSKCPKEGPNVVNEKLDFSFGAGSPHEVATVIRLGTASVARRTSSAASSPQRQKDLYSAHCNDPHYWSSCNAPCTMPTRDEAVEYLRVHVNCFDSRRACTQQLAKCPPKETLERSKAFGSCVLKHAFYDRDSRAWAKNGACLCEEGEPCTAEEVYVLTDPTDLTTIDAGAKLEQEVRATPYQPLISLADYMRIELPTDVITDVTYGRFQQHEVANFCATGSFEVPAFGDDIIWIDCRFAEPVNYNNDPQCRRRCLLLRGLCESETPPQTLEALGECVRNRLRTALTDMFVLNYKHYNCSDPVVVPNLLSEDDICNVTGRVLSATRQCVVLCRRLLNMCKLTARHARERLLRQCMAARIARNDDVMEGVQPVNFRELCVFRRTKQVGTGMVYCKKRKLVCNPDSWEPWSACSASCINLTDGEDMIPKKTRHRRINSQSALELAHCRIKHMETKEEMPCFELPQCTDDKSIRHEISKTRVHVATETEHPTHWDLQGWLLRDSRQGESTRDMRCTIFSGHRDISNNKIIYEVGPPHRALTPRRRAAAPAPTAWSPAPCWSPSTPPAGSTSCSCSAAATRCAPCSSTRPPASTATAASLAASCGRTSTRTRSSATRTAALRSSAATATSTGPTSTSSPCSGPSSAGSWPSSSSCTRSTGPPSCEPAAGPGRRAGSCVSPAALTRHLRVAAAHRHFLLKGAATMDPYALLCGVCVFALLAGAEGSSGRPPAPVAALHGHVAPPVQGHREIQSRNFHIRPAPPTAKRAPAPSPVHLLALIQKSTIASAEEHYILHIICSTLCAAGSCCLFFLSMLQTGKLFSQRRLLPGRRRLRWRAPGRRARLSDGRDLLHTLPGLGVHAHRRLGDLHRPARRHRRHHRRAHGRADLRRHPLRLHERHDRGGRPLHVLRRRHRLHSHLPEPEDERPLHPARRRDDVAGQQGLPSMKATRTCTIITMRNVLARPPALSAVNIVLVEVLVLLRPAEGVALAQQGERVPDGVLDLGRVARVLLLQLRVALQDVLHVRLEVARRQRAPRRRPAAEVRQLLDQLEDVVLHVLRLVQRVEQLQRLAQHHLHLHVRHVLRQPLEPRQRALPQVPVHGQHDRVVPVRREHAVVQLLQVLIELQAVSLDAALGLAQRPRRRAHGGELALRHPLVHVHHLLYLLAGDGRQPVAARVEAEQDTQADAHQGKVLRPQRERLLVDRLARHVLVVVKVLAGQRAAVVGLHQQHPEAAVVAVVTDLALESDGRQRALPAEVLHPHHPERVRHGRGEGAGRVPARAAARGALGGHDLVGPEDLARDVLADLAAQLRVLRVRLLQPQLALFALALLVGAVLEDVDVGVQAQPELQRALAGGEEGVGELLLHVARAVPRGDAVKVVAAVRARGPLAPVFVVLAVRREPAHHVAAADVPGGIEPALLLELGRRVLTRVEGRDDLQRRGVHVAEQRRHAAHHRVGVLQQLVGLALQDCVVREHDAGLLVHLLRLEGGDVHAVVVLVEGVVEGGRQAAAVLSEDVGLVAEVRRQPIADALEVAVVLAGAPGPDAPAQAHALAVRHASVRARRRRAVIVVRKLLHRGLDARLRLGVHGAVAAVVLQLDVLEPREGQRLLVHGERAVQPVVPRQRHVRLRVWRRLLLPPVDERLLEVHAGRAEAGLDQVSVDVVARVVHLLRRARHRPRDRADAALRLAVHPGPRFLGVAGPREEALVPEERVHQLYRLLVLVRHDALEEEATELHRLRLQPRKALDDVHATLPAALRDQVPALAAALLVVSLEKVRAFHLVAVDAFHEAALLLLLAQAHSVFVAQLVRAVRVGPARQLVLVPHLVVAEGSAARPLGPQLAARLLFVLVQLKHRGMRLAVLLGARALGVPLVLARVGTIGVVRFVMAVFLVLSFHRHGARPPGVGRMEP